MADIHEWRRDVSYARKRASDRERVGTGLRTASTRIRRVLESSAKAFLGDHGYPNAQKSNIRDLAREISKYTFIGDLDLAKDVELTLRETSKMGHNPEVTETPTSAEVRNWIGVADRWLQALEPWQMRGHA